MPEEAKTRLRKIMNLGAEIFIGDAPGVDLLVQVFLSEENYHKVVVYYACGKARNNIGFKTQCGFDSYVARDRAMCSDADFGLTIWDKGEY